jgi:hypothetical protein
MIVAGGIYQETCVYPPSQILCGSGGRAALALSGLIPALELHAFQPASVADEVFSNFEPFGIDVHLYPASHRLSFHYLHPLARPRIAPVPLPNSGVVEIGGDLALRFGCLEGSFRVVSETAVFDPQSAVAPESFQTNGSSAKRLAVVLNRSELRATTDTGDLHQGAAILRARDGADVVVVKSGPSGAYIFEGGGAPAAVPAFAAQAIHKVGSGDTFSAAFAYYWGHQKLRPAEAARLASLHTADYVETRRLQFAASPASRAPMINAERRRTVVWIDRAGASAAWLCSEASAGLADLGIDTRVHSGTFNAGLDLEPADDAVLVLATSGAASALAASQHIRGSPKKVVLYAEPPSSSVGTIADVHFDLATALYDVAWA